jgi:hypothetical protein
VANDRAGQVAHGDGRLVPRQRKRKLVLAVCGGQVMANLLKTLPDIEETADVKIVAVTPPQPYEELRANDPKQANATVWRGGSALDVCGSDAIPSRERETSGPYFWRR